MNRAHLIALILAIVLVILFMVRCSVRSAIKNNTSSESGTKSTQGSSSETRDPGLTFAPWTQPPDTEPPVDDPYTAALSSVVSSLKSDTVFVYDLDRGTFALQRGTSRVIYPADITMLWTGIYALTVMPADTIFLNHVMTHNRAVINRWDSRLNCFFGDGSTVPVLAWVHYMDRASAK